MFELIAIIVAIIGFIAAMKFRSGRKDVQNAEMWLEVIDAEEWHRKDTLLHRMQEKCGTKKDLSLVFDRDIALLVTKKLVEIRAKTVLLSEDPLVIELEFEYRLSGSRETRRKPAHEDERWWEKLGISIPQPQPA